MAKKKHQPPAKIKYDKTHPIVSIRVDQELKKELDEIKEMSGKSVGDILREAVGVQGKSIKNVWKRGYAMAKGHYGVTYKCSKCGGNILLDTVEEKTAAAQYMIQNGWGHEDCPKK